MLIKQTYSILSYKYTIIKPAKRVISFQIKLLLNTNERWILLDAIDSGLSVDNIVDIKEYLFKTILEDAGDQVVVRIIISANEYEICRNEQCMDVHTGKYRTFKGYESYRKFILKSREIKDKRYGKAEK